MNDDELDQRIRDVVRRATAGAPDPRPYPHDRLADPTHAQRRSGAMDDGGTNETGRPNRRTAALAAAASALVLLAGVGIWWASSDNPDEVSTVGVTSEPTLSFEVFFSPPDTGDCSAVEGVQRTTTTDDPLEAALGQLLAGPTDEEEEELGLHSWFSEDTAGMLNGVDVDDGVARVDFEDFAAIIPNASTSCGSAMLLSQLDYTVRQFPEVERGVYSFDGNVRAFYEWLQLSPPADDTAEPARTTTTTATTTTTTTEPRAGAPLPGERLDIFPYEGARVAVVGVESDDTLNVRAGPGVGFDVVAELAPLSTDAVATGHNRSLGGAGVWAEVTVGDRTGWANVAFLLQPGVVRDITTELFPTVADRPSRPTMVELGRAVAQRVASEEPPSRIVVSGGPRVGDLGEVTVDVVGLGDDSVGGERLRVFATPLPGGEGFAVRTVEATVLCSRGVTDEGLCL